MPCSASSSLAAQMQKRKAVKLLRRIMRVLAASKQACALLGTAARLMLSRDLAWAGFHQACIEVKAHRAETAR